MVEQLRAQRCVEAQQAPQIMMFGDQEVHFSHGRVVVDVRQNDFLYAAIKLKAIASYGNKIEEEKKHLKAMEPAFLPGVVSLLSKDRSDVDVWGAKIEGFEEIEEDCFGMLEIFDYYRHRRTRLLGIELVAKGISFLDLQPSNTTQAMYGYRIINDCANLANRVLVRHPDLDFWFVSTK